MQGGTRWHARRGPHFREQILESLNTATITTRILILQVLGKNTPSTAKRLIQTQIKSVKQPLLLEGLPTAKTTLVQYKANKPGPSGIFHLQKEQHPLSPVPARCQGVGGQPSLDPLTIWGASWDELSKKQWGFTDYTSRTANHHR